MEVLRATQAEHLLLKALLKMAKNGFRPEPTHRVRRTPASQRLGTMSGQRRDDRAVERVRASGTRSRQFNPTDIHLDCSHFTNYNADALSIVELSVRVISKARLRRFWELPSHQNAHGPLRAWYTHVNNKAVSWQSWRDVKAEFARASIVGSCVVFNIGGNKYRLVTRVAYRSQKVFVLKVMTHGEYDENRWKNECGCFAAPPTPKFTNPMKPNPKRQ
jgi:mRNA interferase HigB